jgi:hypothetical protein
MVAGITGPVWIFREMGLFTLLMLPFVISRPCDGSRAPGFSENAVGVRGPIFHGGSLQVLSDVSQMA